MVVLPWPIGIPARLSICCGEFVGVNRLMLGRSRGILNRGAEEVLELFAGGAVEVRRIGQNLRNHRSLGSRRLCQFDLDNDRLPGCLNAQQIRVV